MRIITGSLKGRVVPFNVKKYGNARVTSGRVKGAAFSILGGDLTGLRFLDLCAGSGQIGLEAFSRGAQVVLNEPDTRRRRAIAGLLKTWGIQDRARLLSRPTQKLLPLLEKEDIPFNVIYLDPPYHEQIDGVPMALALLTGISTTSLVAETGVVLVQHAPQLDLPVACGCLVLLKQKDYGDTALTVYKKKNTPSGKSITFSCGRA